MALTKDLGCNLHLVCLLLVIYLKTALIKTRHVGKASFFDSLKEV